MDLRTHTTDKEEKHFYFIAGLPRSGSTLLANLLNQNPRFHATSTSGVLDMLLAIRNNWNAITAFRATRNDTAKLRVLSGMLHSFYADVDKPRVFDKCRGWLGYMEMAETIIGSKVKVLVPVRDMRDVLASFEKLWRKESRTGQIAQEKKHPQKFQTVEGRCETWLRSDQPVGSAHNRIKDALRRGYADRMFFVRFEDLTTRPGKTMEEIYTFLGEKSFAHDFENVEQTTHEDDFFHGFTDLHTIRNRVAPVASEWEELLGSFAGQYESLNFWEKGTKNIPKENKK